MVALVACLLACGDPSAEPDAPEPERSGAAGEKSPGPPAVRAAATATAPDWTGSAACAECHGEITGRWQSSRHHLAMREATAGAVLGNFANATFRDGPVTWTFSEREGRYLARAAGAEQGEYEIAYTTDSDAQQYLIAFPDGRLQTLPVVWDARPAEAGGQRWGSLHGTQRIPAGDPLHWKSPALSWNAANADYHVTGFRKRFDLAANRYDSRWAEIGVGCEACHGPGSRHVEWARAGSGAAGPPDRGLAVHFEPPLPWTFTGDEPIARPGAGTPTASREIDACAPCHSQRARIVEEPRPGDAFLDGYEPVLLDRGIYGDDGQVDDFAYEWGSFVQTRKHAAGVRCSDCHDPHSGALRAEGNALCGSCHAPARFDAPAHHHHEASSPGASCIACHMPANASVALDARHDHSFPVPRPDLTLTLGTRSACADCHAKRGDSWAATTVNAWRGDAAPRAHFAERLHARRSGGSAAGEALASLVDDETQPAIARATALLELAAAPQRARIARIARAEEPLLRLAAARAALALEPRDRALRMGSLMDDPLRAVRIEAANALADVPAESLSEGRRAALTRALDEYRAAQQVSADQPTAHLILGVLHQRLGDAKAAEDAYLTALRLADYFVPAYANLAGLYAEQQRPGDAATLLHRGLEKMPDSADLHFSLGLLLAQQEQTEASFKELASATKLAPENAHFAYVYSLGLKSEGRGKEALPVLHRALEHRPNDQTLLSTIAIIARDSGRYAEALEAAKRLQTLFPNQPEARGLVEEIENRRDRRSPPASPPSQRSQ